MIDPNTALAIWNSLPEHERASVIELLVDAIQGKPPKAVRIAAIRKRKILALAKVAGRLK